MPPRRALNYVIPPEPQIMLSRQSLKICHPDRAKRRGISLPAHKISHCVRDNNADYSTKTHLHAIPQHPQACSAASVTLGDQSGPAYGFVIFRSRERSD